MNSVILIGRLTADPDLKFISTGVAISKFTIAIDRSYRKDNNSVTDFIPVEVWGKKAEYCATYIEKGCLVAVNGSLHIDRYIDKDGQSRNFAKVTANSIAKLNSPKGNSSSASAYTSSAIGDTSCDTGVDATGSNASSSSESSGENLTDSEDPFPHSDLSQNSYIKSDTLASQVQVPSSQSCYIELHSTTPLAEVSPSQSYYIDSHGATPPAELPPSQNCYIDLHSTTSLAEVSPSQSCYIDSHSTVSPAHAPPSSPRIITSTKKFILNKLNLLKSKLDKIKSTIKKGVTHVKKTAHNRKMAKNK